MNRTDLMEIKKRWKIKDYSISQFSYCVFSSLEGVVKTCVKSFGSLQEDEVKKYLSFMAKGYSTGTTSYNETLKVEDNDLYRCLEHMVGAASDDMLVALSNYISTKYDVPGYYALLCFRDSYDIPARDTASNQKMDESDEVYNYASILLCPLKPNKGGICFMDGELVLEHALPFVQAPVMGMIYPAYTDRASDTGKAFVCVKSDPERRLVSELFSVNVPDKPKPQARIKNESSLSQETTSEEGNESEGDYSIHAQEHLSPSPESALTGISDNIPIEKEAGSFDIELEKALDDFDRRRENLDSSPLNQRASSEKNDDSDISTVEGNGDVATIRENIAVRNVGGKNYYIIPADSIPLDVLEQICEQYIS